MIWKKFLGVIGLYVVTLLTIHYVHFRYLQVDVVLYAALLDVAVSCGIIGGILCVRKVVGHISGLDRAQIILICLLGGYSFAITIPTVIDRSLSFYILEKVAQSAGGIKASAMPDLFRKEYMREHRLVDIRLTEQMESGTIQIIDNCVQLTNRGEWVAQFGRFYRSHFLPTRRLIRDKYTDKLTQPYSASGKLSTYSCN